MVKPSLRKIYKYYVVMLDNFGHDTSGNPIATHTVMGMDEIPDQENPLYGPVLYRTLRRPQIGYSGARSDWAGTALQHANAPAGLAATDPQIVGDRSNGIMYLIYTNHQPDPNAPNKSTFQTLGRELETYTFPDDAGANQFMTEFPGWGLVGIEGDGHGLRHVARLADKGKPV